MTASTESRPRTAAPSMVAATRLGWLIVALVALALPVYASGYHLYQFSQVLIYAIALLGLNLLTGFNGQISLGHGAFFAIGGYGAAILITKFGLPYWAAIPIASAVCFVAGFLFGFPALRLGGLYLALATFALAVATPQILSYKGFDAYTGGSQGLQLAKPHPPFGLPFEPRPVALSRLPRLRGGAVLGRRQSGARAGGARAGRDPRSPDRGGGDGRRRRAL